MQAERSLLAIAVCASRGEARVDADPNQTRDDTRRRCPVAAIIAWALLALASPIVVEPLNLITILGFPLGFLLVAQGALIAFLLIAVLSARRQDRLSAPELTAEERGDA